MLDSKPQAAGFWQKRISFGVIAVACNFFVWQVGIFLDTFGGWRDHLGASLCTVTWSAAHLLVFATLLYSVCRRFLLSSQLWDFYGPALACLALVIMHWQAHLGTRY